MSRPRIILASASPRRSELLKSAGIVFEVDPAGSSEEICEGELAADLVLRLAKKKAQDVSFRQKGQVVLGADTTVVVRMEGKEEILNKPESAAHAQSMLTSLQGRAHCVLTGYAFVKDGEELCSRVVETEILFRALTPAEIELYIASGEPFDKAGAYAIQGAASAFVEKIQGSYSNVVGLPLEEVIADLRKLGLCD